MDTAWIALIGTLFGGAALKLLEGFFAKGSKKIDVATQMRTELRTESQQLKEEIRQAEKELDEWKMKYFQLFQEYLELKAKAPPAPVQKQEVDW